MNIRYRLHTLFNYFTTKALLDKPHKDQLVAHLKALGNTQEEVAKNLRAWGFKGKVNRWDGDPVYNYLQSKNPAWLEITVHRSHITISYKDVNNQEKRDSVWLNENNLSNVAHFITDFDHNLYPELIAQ